MFNMKLNKFFAVLALTFCLGVPAVYAATPDIKDPANSAQDAAQDFLYAIKMKNVGAWGAAALAITQVLIFGIKVLDQTNAQMKKYGTALVLALSGLTAVLGSYVGGMNWIEALILFGITGLPKLINDIAHELGWVDHQNA